MTTSTDSSSAVEVDPGWVRWAIKKGERDAVRLHGRGFLPASWHAWGCGGFGCVFPTRTEGVVCKVTIDGSEAFFARAQSRVEFKPEGVSQYWEPVRVDSPHGSIWLVWRQASKMPTFETFHRNMKRPPELTARMKQLEDDLGFRGFQQGRRLHDQWEEQTGLAAYDVLDAAKSEGLGLSSQFATFLTKVDPHPAMFATALASRMAEAAEVFEPVESHIGWHYVGNREMPYDDPMLTAAIYLMGYVFQIERLGKYPMMDRLCNALLYYHAQGIVLADVQPDNIAHIGADWALFDTGFAVPFSMRWDAMWLDEQVVVERWWKRWETLDALRELSVDPDWSPD